MDIAAVTSAVRSSTSRSAKASTSMPSIPSVPLIRARPSLACNVIGATPAAAAAAGALAFADQGEGDVGERGEIAARPERTVLRNGRRDPRVEQFDDALDDDRTHAGVPQRQRARPQQHHRPDDLVLDRRTHPGGMGAKQRALQLLAPLRRDHRRGERPEPGRDAVDGLARRGVARQRSGGSPPAPSAPRHRSRRWPRGGPRRPQRRGRDPRSSGPRTSGQHALSQLLGSYILDGEGDDHRPARRGRRVRCGRWRCARSRSTRSRRCRRRRAPVVRPSSPGWPPPARRRTRRQPSG